MRAAAPAVTRRPGSRDRRVDTDRRRRPKGRTVPGRATPEHTAKHSAIPPRPVPARTHPPDNSEAGHDLCTERQDQTQTMKGRITHELGRVTRTRRLRRRGSNDRVSGSLKQAEEKTEDDFRRNGSSPR